VSEQRFQKRFTLTRTALTDLVLVTGVLLAVNSMFSPMDPGFATLNPSPFVLLPILLGSRYGFGAGIVGGGVAAFITLVGQWQVNDIPMLQSFSENGYIAGSFVVVGGVCGEIQNYFRTRENQLNAVVEHNKERLKKLDTDLVMMREAKSEMERILATRDAELSTLDADLRRLFDSEQNELYQNLLLLLNRQCRVTDAAVYSLGAGNALERRALLGSENFLPSSVISTEVEMIALALRHKTTVTIPEFWQRTIGQHKNYLVAAPLLDSREDAMGLLIVTGMPFIALNKKTVHLITLICRWASRIIEIRSHASGAYQIVSGIESQRLFTTHFFKQTVELAYQSFLQHNLPSTVVLFSLPNEPISRQDEFEKLMMSLLRGGDFPASIGLDMPHLAVLLPLTGERGAHIFVDRIVLGFERSSKFSSDLRSDLFIFDPKRNVQEFWQDLTTHEKAVALA
jgi:hypothetical protein